MWGEQSSRLSSPINARDHVKARCRISLASKHTSEVKRGSCATSFMKYLLKKFFSDLTLSSLLVISSRINTQSRLYMAPREPGVGWAVGSYLGRFNCEKAVVSDRWDEIGEP